MKTIHSLFAAFARLSVFRLLDRQTVHNSAQPSRNATAHSDWRSDIHKKTAIFRLHLD